ncbi:hypothetical protein ACMX25_01605 [Caballeronia sp. 15715]|uniref:hypothetical protein n=1 Tax=Caballeronia sp. 15715 TaxID=3391030 RepID=UPI0039E4D8CD
MPLKKTIRIAAIGVPASFHTIRRYSVDLDAKATYVDIASYFDEQAARDGLQSIGIAQVMLDTTPDTGEDHRAFCEHQLAAPMPAEPLNPAMAGNPNRYLFADAEIVD